MACLVHVEGAELRFTQDLTGREVFYVDKPQHRAGFEG